MGDPKDLDKYGVWVKNSPKDIQGEESEMPDNAIDDIDLPSEDDMFNDIEFPMTAEDLQGGSDESEIPGLGVDIGIPPESAAPDENEDTTLSPDELLHITGSQDIPVEEAASEPGLDDFDLGGLDMAADAVPAEKAAEAPEIAVPEAAGATEEISFDGMPDGEIDLDDFMSDSGGPSSAPDGDVDLSAFMDGGSDGDIDLSAFMDDAPSSKKEAKPEEIQDELSLDIDVSFDDSADTIAREDNGEEDAPPAAESSGASGGDDMFSEFGGDAVIQAAESPSAAAPSASADDTSEEIDLSDFGFDDDDANIGMTNGPDSGSAPKKEVVDYDMKVSADDDSKTPSVQDVVMGNFESSEETEFDEGEASAISNADAPQADDGGLAINEKGKEILEQIMGELSSLKDEIKNLKNDFAELKDRPTPAAEPASIPAAKGPEAEDTGFFGADDGDDTIALSGNELTNILSSAEFSTEDAAEEPAGAEIEEPAFDESAVREPAVEEAAIEETAIEEPAVEETRIEESAIDEPDFGGADLSGLSIEEPAVEEAAAEEPAVEETMIEEPLVEEAAVEEPAIDEPIVEEAAIEEPDFGAPEIQDDITIDADDFSLDEAAAETDSILGEESELPQEISVPKSGAAEEPLSRALDEEPSEDDGVVSVDDIVKENVSLREDADDVSVGIGSDIHAAFEEADAIESDIADSALAEKDAYENSVSDIMKENISLQEDKDDVSVGVGSDIHAAFEEADATESDIADSALAEKDAYESSKSLDDEFSIDGDENEEPVPETLDESVLGSPAPSEDSIDDTLIEDSFFEEEVKEPLIEESLGEPAIEESEAGLPPEEEPAEEIAAPRAAPAKAAAKDTTSISKSLKSEIVSVLSYMDQLLENLPEDKIAEFAKSEHFVTYKKLFDELGLS